MIVALVVTEGFKMTDIGPLPSEWEVVRLGDVSKVSSGGSAPQGKEFFTRGNPFVRVQHLELESDMIRRWDLITDEAVDKYGLKLYPKGTIVFPKSGASIYLEKRAILPVDAYIVSHLCAVISESTLVDQDYLFYYLRYVRLSEGKAEGYPTLNLTEIKNGKIALPPLPKQKKIAAILSAMQEAKEKTEAVIKATRELKKSLMKHLFTYGPVSPEEAENVPLKETEIGLVPEGWDILALGDLVDVKGGKRLPKGHSFSKEPTPFPYVRVIDFAHWSVKLSDLKYLTYEDAQQLKRYIITTDDVYISIAGTIGLVGVVPDKLNGANLTENAARLIIRDKETLDKRYLVSYLASEIGQQQINTRRTKTSQPKLALMRIKQIQLPVPPLPVQQQIAETLAYLDRKTQVEENKKKALEDLFNTLLSNLVTGKMRINQLEVEA